MAVTAPYSKYKQTNFKIGIVILIAGALYFAYDGHYNKKFIDKHSLTGTPDSTLQFNRKAPPFAIAAGVALAVWFVIAKKRSVVADENELIIDTKTKIAYDSIQAIDKSNYDSKGLFVITYKTGDSAEIKCSISDRTYDNLDAVLEILVSKITA